MPRDETNRAEINVIDADVDVGTNATRNTCEVKTTTTNQ